MKFNRPLPLILAAAMAVIRSTGYELLAQDVRTTPPQAPPSTQLLRTASPAPSNIERKIPADESAAEPRNLSAAAWVELGDSLMQRSRENVDSGLYERARRAYDNALLQDPKNENALVGLAWVCNTQHEFDEGRSWAVKALAVNPKLAQAHALLGDAAVELGVYDDALDHYQKAMDIRPDLSSYSRAAHLVWLMGDAPKGRWLMEKAIKAGGPYPENAAWCRAELALMLWRDGALLPADQQAEAALKQAPTNAHVLAVAGRIKAAKQEYAKAIDLYERAVQIHPAHDSMVALGDLYSLTNRRDESEKRYQRVVDMHKPGAGHGHPGTVRMHTHPRVELARFYADHDRDLDEALREARLAYRDYKNVFVADTLAWCYYKKGQYEEAVKTIRKALRWNTPDASILFHAGMIHAKLGDPVTAKKFLSRALSLNPRFHPNDSAIAAETLKTLSETVPDRSRPADAKPN